MNIMVYILIVLFQVLVFAHYMGGVFSRNNHVILNYEQNLVGCPYVISDYWYSDFHSHCIPPPIDHGAFYAPMNEIPPAICLFINGEARDGLLTLGREEVGLCNYL